MIRKIDFKMFTNKNIDIIVGNNKEDAKRSNKGPNLGKRNSFEESYLS